MGLPSGQQVARLMGVTPLTNAQLARNYRIKVTVPIQNNTVNVISEGPVANDSLASELADPGWNGEAPLWFYILKEAELVGDVGAVDGKGMARTLGPVGGRIVAEVLLGLLDADPGSYRQVEPAWRPELPSAQPGRFTMSDLLRLAKV